MKKPQKGKPPVTRSRKSLIPPEPFRCEISWAHELSTLKSSPNKMPEKWITLRLTGMVLKEEAALLQKCVEALLRIPHQKIILYLGRLPTISGRGIAALLRLCRQAKKLQHTLEVRSLHPSLRRTFEELGLGKVFGLQTIKKNKAA